MPGLAVTIDCLKDDILLDDLVEDLSDSNPWYVCGCTLLGKPPWGGECLQIGCCLHSWFV